MDHREESLRQNSPPATDSSAGSGGESDSAAQTGDDVFNIIAEVEKQLARMRTSQHEQHQQVASLAERAQSLGQAEQMLNDRAESLKSVEHQIQQQARQHEQASAELAKAMQQVESDRAAVAEQAAQTSQQADALAQREAQIAATQNELTGQQADLEAAQRQIEERFAELGQQTQQLNDERQRLLQRLTQSDARSRELADQIASARREVEEKTKKLQAVESRIEQGQKELENAISQRDRLTESHHGALSEIKELRGQMDEMRAALKLREADVAKAEHASTGQIKELTAKLTAAKAEVGKAEHAAGSQIKDLTAKLQAAGKALSDRDSQLNNAAEASQVQIKDLTKKLGTISAALDQREAELAKVDRTAKAQVEEMGRKLAAAASALEQREAEIGKVHHAAEAQAKDLAAKLSAMKESMEEREAAMAQHEAELAKATKAAEAARSQAQDMSTKLERAAATLSKRDAELADNRSMLATAGKKLSEFATVLGEQSPELERGYAAMAELEQQRRQIEQLEKQLASYKLAASPEEVLRKDQRIEELTEALRQARGQRAGDVQVPDLEHRIAALNAELEQSRLQEQQANVEADRLAKELDELRRNGSIGTSQNDQSIIRELEQRIVALQAQAAAAEAQGGSQTDAKSNDQMRVKMQRLKAAAVHLQRRKARLESIRKKLRQPGGPRKTTEEIQSDAHDEFEDRARHTAQIHQQRSQLRQLHEQLAAEEEEMVRRWARPKAVASLVWLTAFMLIVAVGSWLGANQFFPATVSASVTLEAEPRPGKIMSVEEAAKWQEWHTNMLKDPAFHGAVAKKAESRRLDKYRDPAAVGAKLNRDLSRGSDRDGQIQLALAGSDRNELCWLLDIVATTLSSESARQYTKRGDGSHATILGERKEDGQVRYARINPVPIADYRLKYAAIIFGVSCLVAMVLVGLVYSRLLQTKRIFEAETAVVPAGDSEEEEPVVPLR